MHVSLETQPIIWQREQCRDEDEEEEEEDDKDI